MRPLHLRLTLFAGLSALALAGCVHRSHALLETTVTPVRPQAGPVGSRVDLYYAEAVQAIGKRDYARALNVLQAARQTAPGDVRVINAFAVVYDKLGRFDLSRRYYAQARQIDPDSAIVQQNFAYSGQLQGLAQKPTAFAAGAAPAGVQPQAYLVQEAPGVVRLLPNSPVVTVAIQSIQPEISPAAPKTAAPAQFAAAPTQPKPTAPRLAQARLAHDAAPAQFAAVRARVKASEPRLAEAAIIPPKTGPKLAGAAIQLVDASGSADAAHRLRGRLGRLGWSVDTSQAGDRRAVDITRIDYPARSSQIALALARTLPGRVAVRPCAKSCTAIRLVVGRDSLSWGDGRAQHKLGQQRTRL